MSFADVEAGLGRPTGSLSTTPQSPQDAAFLGLNSSISLQVFKINANVQGILKLVDQLGTARDTGSVRKALHDITETTREMAKRGTDDLKKLAVAQTEVPHQKGALQKTSHDFQMSLVAFQRAQQLSAEKQRTVIDGVKLAVDEEQERESHPEDVPLQQQQQAQILQSRLSPAELAHQESLIQERESEIRQIETGIHELSQIFRDLGTLVNEQGNMIDNIESNISNIAVDTTSAAEELGTAHRYQKRAGRRAACLMIVVVFVVCIVLIAILS